MNRVERRRELKLRRVQSLDLEGIRNSDQNAIQAALAAIETNIQEQRFTKARKLCESALAVNPQNSRLNHAIGLVHQSKGEVPQAIDAYQTAISVDPEFLGAWVNLGICARQIRDTDTALRAFDRAVAIDPKTFLAYYNRALIHCDVRNVEAATVDLNKALELKPDSVEARFQLGFLRELQGEQAEAIEHYGSALGAAPNAANLHARMGACLQMVGRFEEGAEHLKKAVELDPGNGHAHYLLAYSEQADAALLPAIEKQISRATGSPQLRAHLHFAAARLHERAQSFDQAFSHYARGNSDRNKGSTFDRERLESLPDRIEAVFTDDFLARLSGSGDPTEAPVFVVGVPRSGTTLIEQIIASHPQAFGAGELANLNDVTKGQDNDSSNDIAERIPKFTATDIADVARRYLAALPDAARTQHRFVDKTPGNALWLGLIALMFPNATLIHCDRDPMDTCWSCYTQNFFGDVPYANDLEDLAAYYHVHRRVMDYWRKVLPAKIVDIRYEELVNKPEPGIRRIIEACGLDWDDRCLAFNENKRGVNTTSLWQVRKPVFSTSVGRWKPYEAHIGALKSALDRSDA